MPTKERLPLRADFLSRFAFDSLYEGNETTVYGPPLTISDGQMKFNYNAGHFTLNGDNFEMGAWIGSTHIITLGTITTGVWQATKIAVAYGGTGLTALGTANQLLGVNAGATALEYKTLSGTTNQISITNAAGSITLACPQDIATTSSPSFYGLNLTQQNSTAGLIIKNAETFDPAYSPLSFQDYTGEDVGSMFIDVHKNIAIGKMAMIYGNGGPFNTVAIGSMAAANLRNGTMNVGLGYFALNALYGGSRNIAIGDSSPGAYAAYEILAGHAVTTIPTGDTITATPVAGGNLEIGDYVYTFSFVIDGNETTTGFGTQCTTTFGDQKVELTDIPVYTGPMTCTARKIYRSKVGSVEGLGKFYLLTTIANNTDATYDDTTADVALGAQITASDNIILIGNYLSSIFLRNVAVVGGGSGAELTDLYFNSYYDDTPTSFILHSQGGSGANVAGANFTIAPGQGTGSAVGGSFKIQVAPAGGAGSTWNALQDALVIDSTKTITTGIWGATVIGATKGGTGQTVYAVGDLLYSDTTTSLTKLADVAVGAYLASGGVNTAPSWATLNQAAVADLKTSDGPTFAHLHLSDLAAIYTPAESWVGPSSTTGIYFKSGNVGIGSTIPTSKLQVVGLPAYANNAAAVAGGLTAGAFYRTGGDPDPVCVVH